MKSGIDRIQGMTVDYAILYIPGRNPGFALDERRFNVATSRSRSTTLIISDIPLTNMHSLSSKVAAFIKKCSSLGDKKEIFEFGIKNVFKIRLYVINLVTL